MKSDFREKISIIIPTYNEEKVIRKSIKKIYKALSNKGFSFEIIITDDGSLDNTKKIIRQLKKRISNIKLLNSNPNQGKGHVLTRAFKIARGDVQLYVDADIPFQLNTIIKLIKFIEDGEKIVIGSRHLKNSDAEYPFLRRILSVTYSYIANKLCKGEIKDYQCGLKGFKKETILELIREVKNKGWLWDTEILLLAQEKGIKIKEIPVTVRNIFKRKTKVRLFKDGFFMILGLIKLRSRLIKNHNKNKSLI